MRTGIRAQQSWLRRDRTSWRNHAAWTRRWLDSWRVVDPSRTGYLMVVSNGHLYRDKSLATAVDYCVIARAAPLPGSTSPTSFSFSRSGWNRRKPCKRLV